MEFSNKDIYPYSKDEIKRIEKKIEQILGGVAKEKDLQGDIGINKVLMDYMRFIRTIDMLSNYYELLDNVIQIQREESSKHITVKSLVKKAHQNARDHGFWEDWDAICWEDGLPKRDDSTLDMQELFNNAISTRLMLIVSELGEALEALRRNDRENFKEELADAVIRIADLCGGMNIDLEAEILAKMAKNKNRPYKHGKSF